MTLKEFLSDGDRFAKLIGVRLLSVSPGHAKAELLVTSQHLNAGGVCQGGAIFTLADLVFAAIVNQQDNLTFAINSTILYHVSGKEGDLLTAEGHMVCPHHKIPYAEVLVKNQDGVHIASFTGQAYVGKKPNTYVSLE